MRAFKLFSETAVMAIIIIKLIKLMVLLLSDTGWYKEKCIKKVNVLVKLAFIIRIQLLTAEIRTRNNN